MGRTNVRRDIRALAISLTAASLLAGCGWFHSHRNEEYKKSVEERPLEVPPDLDRPNTTGALTIPGAGTGSAAATVSGGATAAPGEAPSAAPSMAAGEAGAAATAAAPSSAVLSEDGLHVADTVDSTWNRVGLAMERSGAATILGRDEAGRSYDVQTAAQVTAKPGWFKKIVTLGMAKGTTTAQVRLTLRVLAEGDGSKVVVEGANDDASRQAAQALLATLKQRLS
jgi:uncharacterized lipoprotein